MKKRKDPVKRHILARVLASLLVLTLVLSSVDSTAFATVAESLSPSEATEVSVTEAETETEAETVTESETSTETESTIESESTTQAESTAETESTTEEESETESETVTESETTTESETIITAKNGISLASEGDSSTNTETYTDGLVEFAEGLFGTNGTAKVAELTVEQSPEGGDDVTILSGEAINWTVTLKTMRSGKFPYSGFASTDKTVFKEYEDTSLTIYVPKGVTITGVTLPQGYSDFTYEILKDEDGRNYVVITLGTIDASNGDWTGSMTISATVDTDPEPATGTVFELTEDDIVYSTTVTVLDRDLNKTVGSYTLTSDNCDIKLSDTTLTSGTDDDSWEVTKKQVGDLATETIDGKDYIVATYNLTLTLDNMTQLSQYARDGRVNFAAFTFTDTPVMTDDQTGETASPVYVVVTPTNFSGMEIKSGSLTGTDTVSSVSINQYATVGTVTATDAEKKALAGIEDSVPVYSTYTVTAYYLAEDCDGTFYDAKYFDVTNTAELSYTLDYVKDTEPITGSSEDEVTDTYDNNTKPATLDLRKYINSIYGYGDYVSETDNVSEEYTGAVTFTLTSGEDDASVWAYIGNDYVLISNEITIERGQMHVTVSGEKTTYNGVLYLEAGTYTVEETDCEIANVAFDYFKVDGEAVEGDTYTFTVKESDSLTVTAYNTEERGSIRFTKYKKKYSGDYTTETVEGAVFTLYDSESNTVDTATSGEDGTVSFDGLTPGTYTLVETKAASGYLLDDTEYNVTVSANTISKVNSDGSIYNIENETQLTFEKYLLSTDASGTLTKVNVSNSTLSVFEGAFTLEWSIDGGKNWETYSDTSIEVENVSTSVGSSVTRATLSLPVYIVDEDGTETAIQYRIVETLPTGYSGYDGFDEDLDYDSEGTTLTTKSFTVESTTTVSLTNYAPGEISATKYLYEVTTSGYSNGGVQEGVTLYLLAYDGTTSTYTRAGEAVTDENGAVTISGVDLYNDNGTITYYWAEEISGEYTLVNSQEDTVTVNGVEMVILDQAAYATAPGYSANSATTLYNLQARVRVTLEKRSTTTDNVVSGAAYEIYQDTTNGEPYLTGTVGSTTLILKTGHIYYVYETEAPEGYSDLVTVDENDYITIDLRDVTVTVDSDGVKAGTVQDTYILYNTPYPTVTLTKKLVDGTGSQSDYPATFTVYYSEDGKTWQEYTTYSTYTANSKSDYLEPGYYYAFAENVEDGNLNPADGDSYYTLTSSYLTGEKITVSSGNPIVDVVNDLSGASTVFAFVTNIALEAGTDYSLGTLLNYKNEGSVTVKKTDETGGPLKDAVIGIYSDEDCKELLNSATTNSNGTVTFTQDSSGNKLAVYDTNGGLITYYIKEIEAPEGYFVNNKVQAVTLTAGKTVSATISDEVQVEVSVLVTWEDCYYNDDPDANNVDNLAGATVYCYVSDGNGSYTLLVDDDGNPITAISDEDGYATFSGLSHGTDYVFVLGDPGDTTADSYYPLYASEDDSKEYADGTVATLTVADLENYVTVYHTTTQDEAVGTETATGDLRNHKLYFEVSIQKYCSMTHEDAKLITLQDGTKAYYVNDAIFYLYQQELDADDLAILAAGGNVELVFDASSMTPVTSGSSGETANSEGGSNTGYLTLEHQTYDSRYVYWLVEAVPGTAHTWPEGTSYYRILLYADELNGTVSSDDATDVDKYTKNSTPVYDVENIRGSGSHQFFITTIYMNKWGTEWNEYGVASNDYFPLNGAAFTFNVSNTDGTKSYTLSSDTSSGDNTAAQAEYDEEGNLIAEPSNTKGQFTGGRLQFARLYNDWLVYVVNDSTDNMVESISDITEEMLNAVTWSSYTGMFYTSSYVDAKDDELLDLAANDGTIAIQMYKALVDYCGGDISSLIDTSGGTDNDAIYTTYISYMENVMATTGSLHEEYGYTSYYVHITFSEDSAVSGYDQNATQYELTVQFKPTGADGSANTKYFYLDEVDRTDYYYGTEPVSSSIPIDNSLDNGTKIQIGNVETWAYSTTITKYGYTLTSSTTGKTNAELDTYFEAQEEIAAAGGTAEARRTGLSGVTFAIQRYDTATGTWKYYVDSTSGTTGDTDDYTWTYTSNQSEAKTVTTGENGSVSVDLPIGHYRLIELNTASGYENIANNDSVTISGTETTTNAVCYFQVEATTGSTTNEVNVYDPNSVDLTVVKQSLSSGGSVSGVTITLTDKNGNTYDSKTTGSDGKVTFENLPSGTYTVTESAGSAGTTTVYTESFTITVGYTREAVEGDTYAYTEYATVVTGVNESLTVGSAYEDYITLTPAENTDDVTLTITNPRTGQLTINKVDAADNTSLSGAEFALYYKAFDTSDDDAYLATGTGTTPSFSLSDTTGWTKLSGTYSVGTVSNLDPGWYAVVETKAPDGYEMASPVVTYVSGDMVDSGHTYQTDSKTIEDTKMVGLSVTKSFSLSDYYDTLQGAVSAYTVTYGLYVRTTEGTMYEAEYFDLTDESTVTVSYSSLDATNKAVLMGSATWQNVIQMEDALVEGVYTATGEDGKTYTLDGYYYIKEEFVKNGSGKEVASDWWISNYSISNSSMDVVESDGYYKVTGLSGNATGTVSFTNSYGYAQVTIQKTDTEGGGLSGVTFKVYTDEAKTQEVTDAVITDNEDGTYTISVPMQSPTGSTYYIYETEAPTYYTVNDEPLTVFLKSGDVKSYTSDFSLIMTDNNGVELVLRKFDNVMSNRDNADGLNGVTFSLYRRTYDATTEETGEWELVRMTTTQTLSQEGDSYAGVIDFGAQVASNKYQYMVVETSMGSNAASYVDLETVRSVTYDDNTLGGTIESAIALTTEEYGNYTCYIFQLSEDLKAGTYYYLEAFNEPMLDVTFTKESGETDDTDVPTTTLQIYEADGYTSGQSLTEEDLDALMAGDLVDTDTTEVANGADYSAATFSLAAGTYLVVETATDQNYTINKDDSRTCWYQIVTIEVPTDGSKEILWDTPFVNVKESYSVALTKTASVNELDSSLLTTGSSLTYDLAVTVNASGPINNMILTDDGLSVTEVYTGASGTATESVSEDEAKDYLNYTITSVQIPDDAYYDWTNLIFDDSNLKNSFTPSITAAVTFTYDDGSSDESPKLLTLTGQEGAYKTATPDAGKTAVSFTVTWYDGSLRTQTGYDLGSNFTVSSSRSTVKVNVTINGQKEGAEASAVAKLENTADVSYNFYSWDKEGYSEQATRDEDDAEVTAAPNVEAPELTLSKEVENKTSDTRDAANQTIIGDTLLYTITLGNESDSEDMENPVIIDLLPQGLEIDAATDDYYAAHAEIITEDSGLDISGVQLIQQDGYVLLVISTTGSLAAGESVQLTLQANVTSTIVNYLTTSADITNTVWVTSTAAGPDYKDKEAESAFKAYNSSGSEWADDLSTGEAVDTLKTLLGDSLDNYNGFLQSDATVNYIATDNISVLKEIQGDQDEGVWSSSGAVSTTKGETVGSALFRLTATNGNASATLGNLTVVDVIPQKDGIDFNTDDTGTSTNKWTLVYDEITSVVIQRTEGTTEELDNSQYTVWYYTGELSEAGAVSAMESAFKSDPKGDGWTTTKPADEDITAFAIVVDSSYTLGSGDKLIVTYNTTVPEMNDDELEEAIHEATYNCYTFYYTKGSSSTLWDLTSNPVYAVLSSEPVGVGGMVWIDANNNGIQDDEEDVVLSEEYSGSSIPDYSDYYNSRTNNYASYNVVEQLLNSITITLQPYTGVQAGATTSQRITSAATGRFLFEDLAAASLSSIVIDESTAYNNEGILYNKLAGANSATYYQLSAYIGGVSGVSYSVTGTRQTDTDTDTSSVNSIYSIDPSDLYDTTNDLFEAYSASVLADNNFASTSIVTGSATVTSEKFFLYATSDEIYDLSKDLGLVIYRDLEITKTDDDGGAVEGATFKIYGPYATGEADKVEELDEDMCVGTLTTDSTGVATLQNLLYFQEYIIVEVSCGDDYDLSVAEAESTNIADATNTYSDGDGTTYSAWILNIPSDGDSETNPTSSNTVTTDHVAVTNHKKMTIELTKIDGEEIDEDNLTEATTLAGAEFALYDADSVTVDPDDGTVTLNEGATALYTATSDAYGYVKFVEEVTDPDTLEVTYNDKLLSSGTYCLVETKAPDGYVLLTRNYWTVDVNTKTQTFTISGGSYYGDSEDDYYIPNYTQYTLPSTDGIGRPMLWITLLGCLLMLSAAGLWLFRKRSRAV